MKGLAGEQSAPWPVLPEQPKWKGKIELSKSDDSYTSTNF
jgi:hypothetical protein